MRRSLIRYPLPVVSLIMVCVLSLASCSAAPPARTSPEKGADTDAPVTGSIRFLESFPAGTALDLPEFAPAWQVWPEVLDGAGKSVDVASFYFSRLGDGTDKIEAPGLPDRLLPSLAALPRAGKRGCRVRVLGDSKFSKTYPEALDELNAAAGVESRAIDCGQSYGGGVMHAKYFVVDDRTLYVGSQNWDWRALNEIRELGALVEHPALAGELKKIFDLDWRLAGGEAVPVQSSSAGTGPARPAAWIQGQAVPLLTAEGDTCRAGLAASPRDHLPAGVPWDLPSLLGGIDGAQQRVRLQLLSYGLVDRDGTYWPELDSALRAAAARKVQVQIILSNWAKAGYSAPWIKSLAAVPNIEVKFSDIPENEAGFIPYARVEHPKYMTVDGRLAWVGTSNWSRDYFYSSRNVSLFLEGAGVTAQLDRFFELGWNGPYTQTVTPCGDYHPPRKH